MARILRIPLQQQKMVCYNLLMKNWQKLIFFLLLVIFLLFGFRAGQKVERVNKKIEFILSLTPTKSPTSTPAISYQETKINRWIDKIKHPNNLEINYSTKSGQIEINFKK